MATQTQQRHVLSLNGTSDDLRTSRQPSVMELSIKEISMQEQHTEFIPTYDQFIGLESSRNQQSQEKQIEQDENFDSQRDVRFYSVAEQPSIMLTSQNPRKLSVLYDDWVRQETLESQYLEKRDNFSLRYNRLYVMKANHDSDRGKTKAKYEFSFNLTQLMLAQMNVSPRLVNFLVLNIIVDIFFRMNFVAFMVISAFENRSYLETLLIFLYVPRILHIFTLTKLMFLDKYDPYSRPLLNLSHLVRSNFVKEDGFVNDSLHPFKRPSRFSVVNIRSTFFLILPVEISVLTLPMNSSFQRRRAQKTFILVSYILKGIEAILFQPVLLILMLTDYYAFKNSSYPELYEQFTFFMVIADISKYILLSTLLLIRGNRQKHQVKKRMLNVIHAEAIKQQQQLSN